MLGYIAQGGIAMENDCAASQWDAAGSGKRIYTANEIADILSVSRNTVYALIRSGVFHAVKIGNKYRVSRKCFEEWIEGGNKDDG